jgi:hypothetical protein
MNIEKIAKAIEADAPVSCCRIFARHSKRPKRAWAA